MRGKHRQQATQDHCRRIIPARAGQTRRCALGRSPSTDHPRACGANQQGSREPRRFDGSSPRVRGKLAREGGQCGERRIIPARAGQTLPLCSHSSRPPDHPRACGANVIHSCGCTPVAGSSPRVRGKPGADGQGRGRPRIIPARAGQTYAASLAVSLRSDHPRACGANAVWRSIFMGKFGSSPRVRGKLRCLHYRCPPVRIIPARAGQTVADVAKLYVSPDHPRACGANHSDIVNTGFEYGSSPRVRGKLAESEGAPVPFRIIPARAGQTGPYWPTWLCPPDHPRACGANSLSRSCRVSKFGSSPRVRGKRTGIREEPV